VNTDSDLRIVSIRLTERTVACKTIRIETEGDTTPGLRLGVLTSGGDAPGMNAVIAGACEQAERLGGRVYGIHGGFAGLAQRRADPISGADARDRMDESGTWLGTSRWAALRSPEGLAECHRALRALDLNALLVIGGNGSAMGARALADAVPVAFVPATIDRDIDRSESTIGMDSAIAYAVATIDQLRVTARSLPGRAFLVQTLGAPNGFLADAVAATAGVDHVLVPERDIDMDAVASALRDLAPNGSAIAVMSEAVGDAVRIGEELAERAGIRVHPTILGHAQRAAAPSAHDRAMGMAAGRAAVEALSAGRSTFISLGKDGTARALPMTSGADRPVVRRPTTTRSAPMSLGYDRPLYILASDHRTSFQTKLFGIDGTPSDAEREMMAEAKRIILNGLLSAAETAEAGAVGTLMDEEYGASAARAAKENGLVLALAAEKSSQAEFELEYGDEFAEHIEAFEPDFVKVLVRYNPEGDAEMNRRQAARLADLSSWLAPRETKFLFELIVPPERSQLAELESEPESFATELRPRLTATAIAELQAAGVEPDVWKVEGMNSPDDYRLVADAARAGGRDKVGCVVLGAGADEATVAHWLREAAGVDGFIGFAIGRTIFWEPLSQWIAGSLDADAAAAVIGDNYRRTIELYGSATQAA
jgi:6-phosphofructokinase/myo-inositol catabolism protein IolC